MDESTPNTATPQSAVPTSAKAKRPFFLRWWFLTIVGLIVIGALLPKSDKRGTSEAALTSESSATVATANDTTTANGQVEPAATVGAQWTYDETPDKMGRGVSKTASVQSTNTFEFDFPYTGEQHATLVVRSHPKYGKDVYVQIEKGQYQCGYDDCSVSVRFDDDAPRTYSAAEPADGSTTTLFLHGYDRFVKRLKTAKRVLIEAQFYQEGTRVLEFDVSGFDWK